MMEEYYDYDIYACIVCNALVFASGKKQHVLEQHTKFDLFDEEYKELFAIIYERKKKIGVI